jgi:hypothetical protein
VIEKDLSKLSKDDLWTALMADSPELLELLRELKDKLVEIQDFLKPLIERYHSCAWLKAV